MRRRSTLFAVAVVVVAAVLAAVVYAVADRGRRPPPDRIAAEATSSPAARPTSAPAGLQGYYDQRIGWARCTSTAQCATLSVPVDYAHPDGPTAQVALLRVPARDQTRRLGSLVVDPGGPGGSGVDYAAAADRIVSSDVRDRYDIVGFDPRGVGRSTPAVECLTDPQLDAFFAIDTSPDNPTEVQQFTAASRQLAAGCAAGTGALLPHVGTVDVARDLDVLRGALGEQRLSYLGKSYGTLIGAEYARQFPSHVGRLVLDGAIDPRLTGEQFALGQAGGFELALTQFLADCVSRDCPLGTGDVASARVALDDLVAGLDATPLPTDDSSRPLTQSLGVLGVVFPMYLGGGQGYPLLREALAAAEQGQGQPLLTLADEYASRRADGTYPDNQFEAMYAVNCLDRRDVDGPAAVQRSLPAFQARSPLLGAYLAWSGLPCAYWPDSPTGRAGAITAAGAAPILVVGTTGDPATPYAWAAGLARQLDSGVLLTLQGTGHTAYRQGSACIDSAVDAYLLAGLPPPDGKRCGG